MCCHKNDCSMLAPCPPEKGEREGGRERGREGGREGGEEEGTSIKQHSLVSKYSNKRNLEPTKKTK